MKTYVVDFIFRVYIEAENEGEALELAEYALMDEISSGYDQVNIEEL